ncbi:MAG TPA: sulfite exporter TauE/SafE family protein [Candidatus Limnocylindrales bacterium]
MACARSLARGLLLGAVLVPVVAGGALAHPLGNFTINHYTGIRVEPSRVLLDVVIDEAEIPTFQARQAFDTDADGALSAAELAAARQSGCASVGRDLRLAVAASSVPLRLVEAGITFPPGNAGLSTLRMVCTFDAALRSPIAAGTAISCRDDFEAGRIGWREVTVLGSGVTVDAAGMPATSVTGRLTSYPAGLTGAPDVRSVSFAASPGGPVLPAFDAPDATPLAGAAVPAPVVTSTAPRTSVGAATPSGEASIPDILRAAPATPLIGLIALLTAAVLGAGHAMTPGHGKTLMAAYLVGTRGTPRHAVGLGMAVSVSHTLGILGLATVVLAAESTLPPDLVVRVAPLVAAVSIVLIGGWMLMVEVRRGFAARRALEHAHEHDDHEHAHDHPHDHDHDHDHDQVDGREHSHGGVRHSHVPPAGSTISWRSLFVLGLAGGLVPSASALLILLATIAAGRPAWGVILVAAFGLGMAAVMTGVGLAFVHARGLLERAPAQIRLARAVRLVPAGAAILVLAVGVVLTTQALSVVALG